MDGGHLDRAGRAGMQRDLVGAGVIRVDRRNRRVIGEDEPRDGTTVDALDGAADRASAGQVDGADQVPVVGAMERHLRNTVTRAHDKQQVACELRSVEDGHGLKHGIGILGDQVGPGIGSPCPRVRDSHSPTRGSEVGADEDATITQEGQAGLRVGVTLNKGEGGCLERALGEVRDPQVIARLGALTCGHLQPVAVAADLDAVVVRHRHPRTEDEVIGVG